MRTIPILTLRQAAEIHGGMSQTSKMPCKSSSLPTIACNVGAKMATVAGSICSTCYANKGNYVKYAANIEPAQHARLVALDDPLWLDAMVRTIGTDPYFRHHDSGDLQNLAHLELIVELAKRTPGCRHWLPTREYAVVGQFVAKHGRDSIPGNLVIRLSAMFPDVPVRIPASLAGVRGITSSNVHSHAAPVGQACIAPQQKGECRDCRACWSDAVVSYHLH